MMNTMDASPRLVVASGPDQGKAYALSEELVHIGRGPENHVVLTDAGLAEHHASLVRRNGRYAIYSPGAGQVSVDGSSLPGERWVWLPSGSSVMLGGQTVVRIEGTGAADAAASPTPLPPSVEPPAVEAASPVPRDSATKTPAPGRGKRKGRGGDRKAVARFISDRQGEPLVRLGEDGQLPALTLSELAEDQPLERRRPKESNPLPLYVALAASFVLSLAMLLIDPQGPRGSSGEKAEARAALREFYGGDGDRLEPYQLLLRQALVDHSKGDTAAEHDRYRRVLRMLNSADIRDPHNLNGLTGRQTRRGRASDDALRRALETLLAR